MRTQSNSLGLVAIVAALGLAGTVLFVGCDGGESSTATGAGASGGSSSTSGAGGSMDLCGNGKLDELEACDDGNTVVGDGCEFDCSFSCTDVTAAKCDDKDLCNGQETCGVDHKCEPGKPADNGTACGEAGNSCNNGVCVPDTCGDGFTSGAEECDDGNVINGDGCDSCKFSCSSDANCAINDVCVGQKCDLATHTCGPALAEGDICGDLSKCIASVCTSSCGNAMVDPGEDCDDGNVVNGDGCDSCKFSCVNPTADCPAASVCNKPACDAAHMCNTAPDAAQDGMACDAANPTFKCKGGACQAPGAVCGNGLLEMGEACDFGAGNGPGKGCETTCTFSCVMDADCADAETCNGTETCVSIMVGNQTGKQCKAGTNLANCTACAGGFCGTGSCKASSCGDTCIDANMGEQCEPPGSVTCDASCKTIVVAACGNNVRDIGEQCDDGNKINLDGCDSVCKFEQVQRANWLSMQFGTDAYCTVNGLGGAIGNLAQGTLQTALDDGVKSGGISIVFKSVGLDDLTGTSDPMLQVGVLNAVPVIPMGAVYDGTTALDWWHTVDTLYLDANRTPLALLNGAINAKTLTAGPGSMTIGINIAGSPAPLKMSNAKFTVLINATTTPLMSSNGYTPGHLASEQLDPALVSFTNAGQPTANGAGKLCGNVSAASLAKVPAPAALIAGGANACIENYTATSSLLDILIGGCKVLGGIVTVINKKQPDQVDASLPPLGAGGNYVLSAMNPNRVVDTCKDKNGVTVDFAACLNTAAYSSFFKFTTNRVIPK